MNSGGLTSRQVDWSFPGLQYAAGEWVRELCGRFKLPIPAAETVGTFTEAGHADSLETLLEVMEQEAEDRRVDCLKRASKLLAVGKT